jgi:hypothetical protein
MKKTLKDKILEIVPAKCDSWIICDFYVFDSWIVCDFATYLSLTSLWFWRIQLWNNQYFLTYLLLITPVCILFYLDDTLE